MSSALRKYWICFYGLILCTLWLCTTSCQNGNTENVITNLPTNKLKNVYPIRIGKSIILTSDCDGVPCLQSVDIESRSILWQWVDSSDILKNLYHDIKPYANGKYLAIPFKDHLKIFDVAKGKLIHNIHFEKSTIEPYLSGMSDTAIIVLYSEDQEGGGRAAALSIDLSSGRIQELYHDIFPADNVFKSMPPLILTNGKYIYSILTYSKEVGGISHLVQYDSKINRKDSIIAYPLNKFGFGIARPAIKDLDESTSYWQTTDGVIKLNNSDFEIEWNCNLGSVILTSELFSFKDMVIFPSEDLNFYLIDKDEGAVQDSLTSAPGTPSKLFFTDGKISFVGGTDGYLYRWGVQEDMQFRKFKMSDENGGAQFKRQMYADDEIVILLTDRFWWIYRADAFHAKLIPVE